jgi:soluble lytic murein transglycosylase
VKEWIATYGDPRDAGVDTVDWVESIPFSETRNYVQRVLENLQIYRHRLEGGTEIALSLERDLNRPSQP